MKQFRVSGLGKVEDIELLIYKGNFKPYFGRSRLLPAIPKAGSIL